MDNEQEKSVLFYVGTLATVELTVKKLAKRFQLLCIEVTDFRSLILSSKANWGWPHFWCVCVCVCDITLSSVQSQRTFSSWPIPVFLVIKIMKSPLLNSQSFLPHIPSVPSCHHSGGSNPSLKTLLFSYQPLSPNPQFSEDLANTVLTTDKVEPSGTLLQLWGW